MLSNRKLVVIGIVGGIASGKSFAANILVEYGAAKIDADVLGHEVLGKPFIVWRLAQEFGKQILKDEGALEIDRQKLAALVFGDHPEASEGRALLESIVHPEIHAEAMRRLNKLRSKWPRPKAVVLDAPLLLEANWTPTCDFILFLEVPERLRLQRALDRGWTETQFRDREAAQLSLEEKRLAATHIVSANNEEQLREQLKRFWEHI